MPRNISRLIPKEEIGSDTPVSLTVAECRDCRFVQLLEIIDPGYYTDYLMTVSHSKQMCAYQRQQAIDFVQRHQLKGRRVIEVGCGDGNYLDYLRDAGATVAGIEPSSRFRELAESRGHTCHAGYVTRQSPVPEGPYDGFATRQVLEHVPDPQDFLGGIRRSLRPGGVGLIEVPRLEQALEHARFYDFFPDHLNYFSENTLRLACELSGFQVLEITSGMNGEYNIAQVRSPDDRRLESLQDDMEQTVSSLRRFVKAEKEAGKSVAVWGAGGKGLSILAAAELEGIEFVVDSDPHKRGRLTPVSHIPVLPPETLHARPVDVIVLTALAYRREIEKQLRDELGFKGRIAVIGRTLEICS